MNYYISIIFRAIPLLMGAFTFFFGLYVQQFEAVQPLARPAAIILLSLTAICVALYATAATIIRQLIRSYTTLAKWCLPIIGYIGAGIAIFYGAHLFLSNPTVAPDIVAGDVCFGVGLVAACVSTVATASTKFSQIPRNYQRTPGIRNKDGFKSMTACHIMEAIPAIAFFIAFSRGVYLLATGTTQAAYIAGHVEIGLSMICASLIMLVATVVRQIQNVFDRTHRPWTGAYIVLTCGAIAILWGLGVLLNLPFGGAVAPGYVMIGLGLICWSISSKVILLILAWHHESEYASRIPMIPIFTCLLCLFVSSFLFQNVLVNSSYYIPAHVLAGLGAVCFTLFSIVSILESGTSVDVSKL